MISVRAHGLIHWPRASRVGRSFLRRVSLGLILLVVWWTGDIIEMRDDRRQSIGWWEIGWDGPVMVFRPVKVL